MSSRAVPPTVAARPLRAAIGLLRSALALHVVPCVVPRVVPHVVPHVASRIALGVALHGALLAALVAAPLGAQAASENATGIARPLAGRSDADRPVSTEGRDARTAQDQFERNRRAGLRFYNGGADATCEVQIGTLCYWNNNGDVPPPDERVDLKVERGRLLELLGRAAQADPADDWVAGMRVRYALEQDEPTLAITAAQACAGTAWWCEGLRGLALHVSSRHADAARAFDRSLAAMPDTIRCYVTDVTPWLPTKLHEGYRARGCDGRAAENDRIFRLAQPFWMLPANDARNEFYARHIISRVHAQGRLPYDMPWDGSIYAIQVRYGWPTAWSMQTAGALDPRLPSIIGHEPTPSYDFMPTEPVFAAPLSADSTSWDPMREDARMRYATRWATGFGALPHQFARFRRGDATIVAGAWRLTRALRMGPAPYRVGLFLADGTLAMTDSQVVDSGAANGAVVARLGDTVRLASLEVLGVQGERAARVRSAVAPLADGRRLSDILLLTDGTPSSRPTLEQAAPLAWGSNEIVAGRAFGIFWEQYLPPETDSVTVSIRAQRTQSSFFQRLGSKLGLSKVMTPIAVSFTDRTQPVTQAGRSVALTWPEVPPGQYRFTVSVRGLGTSVVNDSTSVLLEVVER